MLAKGLLNYQGRRQKNFQWRRGATGKTRPKNLPTSM